MNIHLTPPSSERDRTAREFAVSKTMLSLSLDASEELLPVLGVPPLAANRSAKDLFRDMIREAGEPRFAKQLYPAYLQRLLSARDPQERAVLDWLGNVYAGASTGTQLHPALSDWLALRFALRFALRGQGAGADALVLSPAQHAALGEFMDLVFEQIDTDGFADQLDAIRARGETSDWDRTVLMRHELVYGDTDSGADPFLPLEFVNSGEGFRRALRFFDLDAHPDFPDEAVAAFARRMVTENRFYMEDGQAFPSLRAVA